MTDRPMAAWDELLASARAMGDRETLSVCARVARGVERLLRAGGLPESVTRVRMAVLRSATIETTVPALVTHLALEGFAAEVTLGLLGSTRAEILQQDSFLYRGDFDLCVVIPVAEFDLPSLGEGGDAEALRAQIGQYVADLGELAGRFRGQIIVGNFALPENLLLPHYQAQQPNSPRYLLEHANHEIARLARERPNVALCDFDLVSRQLGGSRYWHARDKATGMQPYTPAAMNVLGRRVAEIYRLCRRAPVKCLVLDCDNTLWGGIVGEDGVEGIQLGETYPGTCFQQFQKQLAQITQTGFLLALNSKNNEAEVRAVFESHPGSVLKFGDFTTARVNWRDKAENLVEIAEELNIGLESLVFIDDNAFELERVRQELPQVTCLQVPGEPWKLPLLLGSAGIVDRLSVTDEDRKKVKQYEQQRQRRDFQSRTGGYEEYLRGLEMVLRVEPFSPEQHVQRTAQLTQKTNQFNLTTRRYTEADVLSMAGNGASIYLASLRDRFGDYGRIALAILNPVDPDTAELDTFLMSCRAISRGVEDAFLWALKGQVADQGRCVLRATFVPTKRNVVCADFLVRSGFAIVDEKPGSKRYSIRLNGESEARSPRFIQVNFAGRGE